MEVLENLTKQGKDLGYEDSELRAFVKEQQDIWREERSREYDRKKMDHEIHLKEMELEALEKQGKSSQESVKFPKLPHFDEGKDQMDSYLNRFERYASTHKWDKSLWAINLSALLKGKALDVYARLPVLDSVNYDLLKIALLKRFELTEDGFLDKFRTCLPDPGETFLQFTHRMGMYLDRWVELSGTMRTFEGLRYLVLREQFLNICCKDLVLFLKEHVPKTIEVMTPLADQFREARAVQAKSLCGQVSSKQNHTQPARSFEKPNPGSGTFKERNDNREGNNSGFGPRVRRCYRCDQLGHIASDSNCPGKVKRNNVASVEEVEDSKTKVCAAFLPTTDVSTFSHVQIDNSLQVSAAVKMPTQVGMIDQKPVCVLRDTGCSGVIVKRSLVRDEQMTSKSQVCVLADGSKVEVPVARVHLSTPYFSGEIEAWCMEAPLYDVIIGNIPEANDPSFKEVQDMKEPAAAVKTRQQSREESDHAQRYKTIKTPTIMDSDIGPEDIKRDQAIDKSLSKFRELATSQTTKGKVSFFYKRGLLYRAYTADPSYPDDRCVQLVVPAKYRDSVLKMAHESVMSGHLGIKRTINKVVTEFYWPGVMSDIKRFCQSCDVCQRTIPKGKVQRAPLGKMPLVDVPFQRVAVDIVGPIEPRSSKGNRYMLTLMDYATRYPEAVALPSIEAERVAEALVEMFCRIGIPNEMLTDMGTQFTSEVMKEVSRLLSFKQLTTTPYHPICNGLVEKFNGNIKLMLKRICIERPKDWDRYIGPVLFAYRDAPQESLGFTPFELLYGRSVRGPMSILKELWTQEIADPEIKTVYVVDLKERLKLSIELAQSNLGVASKRYARLYNRRARIKRLNVGNKALVLLPTKSNKLLLQWRGPYTVLEKVNDLDYKIQIGNKIKTFHANMLKRYVERDEPQASCVLGVAFSVVVSGQSDPGTSDENMSIVEPPSPGPEGGYHVSDQLSTDQVGQLKDVLSQCSDVLSVHPGLTNLGKHDIKLTTDIPVRSRQYPVPFAMKQTVIDEVKTMLELGVIERSESEYCSNYVIVKKNDGTNRFCVDYRQLNSVTAFDCEPMPNMEDIFVKLSKCRFISKLDLTKGYWQLPLTDHAKPLTAFQTPIGLFQFVTMPFGLVCASASFTRIMRKLLNGMDGVDNFIDDIVVYSRTFEDHMLVLRELFGRLRRAQLTAKPSKCYFCFTTIECLGHIVGEDKVRMLPNIVEAVERARKPESKKQVRSFLGLASFYKKFVPNFATIASPLSDLTRKGLPNKVRWGDAQDRSFESLKKILCSFPILKIAEIDKPFILQTDASEYGLGAVLLQMVETNERMPVAYASRKLNKAEKAYATIEKECLACVWAVQKFQRYLYGQEFILGNARLMRWALLLQPYRYRIVAIPGKLNILADALSRL